MIINGKVHCFFEQSGTFKNEFIKLGVPAEDYDIQNNFGETDHVIDLFGEIEKGYNQEPSIFDNITPDDLVMAFFPCIHFCDAKTMIFRGVHIAQKKWTLKKIMDTNVENEKVRSLFYQKLLEFVSIMSGNALRLIVENPWNTSRQTFLQCNFIEPTFIDTNRTLRGDYFVKPTAYWFVNCEPTNGLTITPNKDVKIVYKEKSKNYKKGVCSEERSMISPDYARNFICDFILGKPQNNTQLNLFD